MKYNVKEGACSPVLLVSEPRGMCSPANPDLFMSAQLQLYFRGGKHTAQDQYKNIYKYFNQILQILISQSNINNNIKCDCSYIHQNSAWFYMRVYMCDATLFWMAVLQRSSFKTLVLFPFFPLQPLKTQLQQNQMLTQGLHLVEDRGKKRVCMFHRYVYV